MENKMEAGVSLLFITFRVVLLKLSRVYGLGFWFRVWNNYSRGGCRDPILSSLQDFHGDTVYRVFMETQFTKKFDQLCPTFQQPGTTLINQLLLILKHPA